MDDFYNIDISTKDYSGDESQVRGRFYPKPAVLSPEKELLMAVLEDALRCLDGASRANKRALYLEDLQWIDSDSEDYVFSFVRVCEELTIDPSALRKRVRQMIGALPMPGAAPKRTVRRIRPGQIDVGDSDHPYVSQNHCAACRRSYYKWYRTNDCPSDQPKRERILGIAAVG